MVAGSPERDERAPSAPVAAGALTALLHELARAPPADGPAALRPGDTLGRFELVRELGRGGFGVVYEARDKELGRTVAVKVVRARGDLDVREERLLHEAEAAARLSHPNVVTLFDVGRCEAGPYLVLERLRGESLARRLEAGALPADEALRVANEVAKALAHAHARGVVHRDLTPGNVFLCDGGQVKVLDFGMAHAFGWRIPDGGTRAYMAPEQARGAPEDERTDVFALGVVLFQMISGELPFPGACAGGAHAPPRLRAEGVPGLADVVQRMIAEDPVQRPRDGAAVLSAFAALRPEATHSRADRAPGPAPWPRRRLDRRRLRVSLAAIALVAAVGGTALGLRAKVVLGRPRAGPPGPAASIAVLPFADMSPGKDHEYLADGIAEDILNALAQVDGLRVPARTSSFYFKGKGAELAEIGRKLNVTHVLEGSVRKAGSQVRIAAQLVNVADGYQLWSENFDGELADVLALQDRFTEKILAALGVRPPSRAPIRGASPRSSDAYTEYLLGRHLYYRNSPSDVARAVRHFERVIELDPRHAPAWGFQSIAITVLAWWAGGATEEEVRRSSSAAEKAIALDPDDAIGYVARSFLRFALLWDWAGARADVERASKLERGSIRPDNLHAIVLESLGRTGDAVALSRKITEEDPLNAVYWGNLAHQYISAGELELARTATMRALDLSPERYRWRLGLIDLLDGSPATALESFARIPSPWERLRLAGAAMANHELGRAEESRRALQALVDQHGAKNPYTVATVYARLGERERAFEWLERAHRQRDLELTDLKIDPLLRGVRDDERYRALLRRMNFPED